MNAGFTIKGVAKSIVSRLEFFRQNRLQERIQELLLRGINEFDILDEWDKDLLSVSEDAETAQRFIQEFLKSNLPELDSLE